jgi:hypothetical protein
MHSRLAVESEAGAGLPPPAADGSRGVAPDSRGPSPPETAAPERPARRPEVSSLAPQRYRVQFTIGGATHEKLRRAQDLLRREVPDGDPGTVFDRALTLLLEDVARKKLAAATKPRHSQGTRAGSRHIPARVKRAVWLRDGGRCGFVAANGRRCSERGFLEFHHREPYAIGGEATVANISLRCRAHNVYEAELAFGSRVPVSATSRSALPVVREAPVQSAARIVRSAAHLKPGGRSANSPRGELRLAGNRARLVPSSWTGTTSPAASRSRAPARAPSG